MGGDLPWLVGTCPRSTRMMSAAAVMHPVIGSLLVRAVEKARQGPRRDREDAAGLGCERVGFMDNFDDCSVLLAFTHRGRQVQLRASARGWAAMYLKKTRGRRSVGCRGRNGRGPRSVR